MAALSIGHYCHNKSRSPIQQFRKKDSSNNLIRLSRQSNGPVNDSSTRRKKDNMGRRPMSFKFFHDFDKFGKGIKENLSPKQKGDWKDVVLMSLSFAVYVYISQMLVSAYCAWVSMPKQSW
ncbi:putative RNA/RNP complex-1-interacting phosphatase [Quillaja saponaria]|uniref:RNA/RNP complex-1-interacting phosphatase n=1 Tax=Quillaja saponaria TaxID=32244 RepID=A0AAD7L0X1_QUISA|nr:putative RNA/RNP complex-1-interacting phosphatase [Quillaja saponaria]